jgi:ankyrin repeat protein
MIRRKKRLNMMKRLILIFFIFLISCSTIQKAAEQGNTAQVRKFIENKVDVNSIDDQGDTSLLKAAYAGKLSTVQYLIENGAALETANRVGKTALMEASFRGHVKIAKLLIEKGANVNARDTDDGYTPLIYAAVFNELEIAQLLIDNNADLNITAKYGRTAIQASVSRQHPKVAKLLLQNGVKLPDNNKALVMLDKHIRLDEPISIKGFKYGIGFIDPGTYTFKVKYDKQIGGEGPLHLEGDAMPITLNAKAGKAYIITDHVLGERWNPSILTLAGRTETTYCYYNKYGRKRGLYEA